MIDLHLHFDGSLAANDIIELANMQGIDIGGIDESKVNKLIIAPKDCRDLNEYLKCFDLPLMVLQTEEALKIAIKRLVLRLDAQDMLYAEIRFAPQLHTRGGLSQNEVISAMLSGIASVSVGVKVNLILCCMRGHDNEEANRTTIELANRYKLDGVVGVDLAGAEGLYKTEDYQELFNLARYLHLNITIHAGEADGASSVKSAIACGARRIGHGVRLIEDKELMDIVRDKGIGVEMCPSSNLQTKAVSTLVGYPLGEYLRRGMQVCVNTDNMTVSDTDIEREFQLLEQASVISKADRKALILNAIEMSFLSRREKVTLSNKARARFNK